MKKKTPPACKIMYTTDGRKVRVRGTMTQNELDVIARSLPVFCNHEGPWEMPPAAQRIHNRRHYICGLRPGHKGPHAWNDRTWTTDRKIPYAE